MQMMNPVYNRWYKASKYEKYNIFSLIINSI